MEEKKLKDELTTKMHSEFTIDRETEICHKAGSIWQWHAEESEEEQKKECELMGITWEEALHWKPYWERLLKKYS